MSKRHRRKIMISLLGTVLAVLGAVSTVFLVAYAVLSRHYTEYIPYISVSILYMLAGINYRRIGMK